MKFSQMVIIIILASILSSIISVGLMLGIPNFREVLRGPQGIQGIQGIKGDTGPMGLQGLPGNITILYNKNISSPLTSMPIIDGYIEKNEWPAFQLSQLTYYNTYLNGLSHKELSWDTSEKNYLYSKIITNESFYACLIIHDDYISNEYQIRNLGLFINGSEKTTIFITSAEEYPFNLWAMNDATANYSHTSNGESGLDGYYLIEFQYLLQGLKVTDYYFHFGEITKWDSNGFLEKSTYWCSDLFYSS